jgi:hypothetical protein
VSWLVIPDLNVARRRQSGSGAASSNPAAEKFDKTDGADQLFPSGCLKSRTRLTNGGSPAVPFRKVAMARELVAHDKPVLQKLLEERKITLTLDAAARD